MKTKRTATSICNQVLRLLTGRRRPRTAAVILAAGSGTRAGGDKQWVPVAGIPVLIRSAMAFDACPYIDEIVFVVPAGKEEETKEMCASYKIRKFSKAVAGGNTRQESAENGFYAISEKTAYVAIHDAARCCVTSDMISDVVAYAYAYRAAIAATSVTDTIKEAGASSFIARTVPREKLYAAQTPQVFHKVYYRAGLAEAKKKKAVVTDDASLMELIGQRVKLVDVGGENIKITTRSDFLHAEMILKAREENSR